jgi:hypothetical protein
MHLSGNALPFLFDGKALDLGVQPGVLNGNRRLAGKQLEHRAIFLTEL